MIIVFLPLFIVFRFSFLCHIAESAAAFANVRELLRQLSMISLHLFYHICRAFATFEMFVRFRYVFWSRRDAVCAAICKTRQQKRQTEGDENGSSI
ncbi:MAG TPA: hypothetical protein DEF33_07790 [Clostridiales bacterium]|nr:hypothetical protein [Clostridiales bacterium]